MDNNYDQQNQNQGADQSGGQQQQQGQGQSTEKQDWLDKGLQGASKKAGYNLSSQDADKVGDFANKEAKQHEGHNIPGVQ